jgi:hypothetical protein
MIIAGNRMGHSFAIHSPANCCDLWISCALSSLTDVVGSGTLWGTGEGLRCSMGGLITPSTIRGG